MVITKEVDLPTIEELTVEEVDLTSAHLMAAGPYVGKQCEAVNNEFMLCRMEHPEDPRVCVATGKQVTQCALEFFQKARRKCREPYDQYVNCIDKSSTKYAPWPCRKTHTVFKNCMLEKMCIEYPGFGYFTRGRIHSTECSEPPEVKCPCQPEGHDLTRKLPTCKEPNPAGNPSARFTSRLYWVTE